MLPRGMLRTVEVGSADDARLADYTRLTDAGLRTHLEAEHGLFIAEGTKVITRAVAAGYPVRSVLLGRGRLADLPALGEAVSGAPAGDVPGRQPGSTPVYVVSDEVAEHRAAVARLGGGTPVVRRCGVDLLDPPTIVVEIVRERVIEGRATRGSARRGPLGRAGSRTGRR